MTKIELEDEPRRKAQEFEIDILLQEELSCDPDFVLRFLDAAGLSGQLGNPESAEMRKVRREVAMPCNGYADLVATFEASGKAIALLVEDKITAAAATRQAERYREFAEALVADGFDAAFTVLVGPENYVGERDQYDAFVSLQQVRDMLRSDAPLRLQHRRGIVKAALERSRVRSSGSRASDPNDRLRDLLTRVATACEDFARSEGINLEPDLATFGEASLGEHCRVHYAGSAVPEGLTLRHRLRTCSGAASGSIELICDTEPDSAPDIRSLPDGARFEPFANGSGSRVTLPVPALSLTREVPDSDIAACMDAIPRLFEWVEGPGQFYRPHGEKPSKLPSWATSGTSGSGVLHPSKEVRDLRIRVVDFCVNLSRARGIDLRPAAGAICEVHYDDDSWICYECEALPKGVFLRHRLWTKAEVASGSMDLICYPRPELDPDRKTLPRQAQVQGVGAKGYGLRVEVPVPELRVTRTVHDREIAACFGSVRSLLDWVNGPGQTFRSGESEIGPNRG